MEVENGNYISIQEAAAYLRIHPITLYRMVKLGSVPFTKVGGSWRTKKEWIDVMFKKECGINLLTK